MATTRSRTNNTPTLVTTASFDYMWYIKTMSAFALYTVVVLALTAEIRLGPNGEKGLVPRFILTISYALGPTLIAIYYTDCRRTAASFLFMQVSSTPFNFDHGEEDFVLYIHFFDLQPFNIRHPTPPRRSKYRSLPLVS